MADVEQRDDALALGRIGAAACSSSGRSRGSAPRSGAGTAGPPGTRSRCGGGAPARSRASAESNSTLSSSAMRPRSGVTRPAIMLTIVVLPEPDGPNSAVTPPAVSNRAAMLKSPRRLFDIDGEHLSLRGTACRRAGRTIPTRSARRARSRWRSRRAGTPRRRRPAPASACRSRPRWSASRPGCWRRR